MDKKMIGSHSNTENLYSKTLFVRLTNSKSEEKYKYINITVDYQTTTLPTHKTELIIKLTDEQDPFFLYSLYMSEEDYQTLKTQQGLLVDFGAFGQKFIDLLNLCEKDEKCDNPKFQLQFFTKEPLPFDHNNGNLNVIEINPFKHLCHLQLTFMPGNDTDVKKYLAQCLQQLRDNYHKLSREYDECKYNLNQRLDNLQQMFSQKSNELDKLKMDYDSQSERLNTKHMQELNFEKEKSLQMQYEIQQKYEKEKKEFEINYNKVQKHYEQRLNEVEASNKELTDKKYKNEVQLQELRSKYTTLQEEYTTVKQELNTIRKQNTNLDSELHTNEKTVNHLRTRIAVLEQEVKDKDELVQRSQDLLNNEQMQRKTTDELLNEKTNENKKQQAQIKHFSQELMKANEIISKLQTKLRTFNNKMRLKNEILSQQEKVVLEKDKELSQIKVESKQTQEQLQQSQDENKELKSSLSKKTQELEEAAKLLKKDENIINWLNKQITELNMNNNNNNFGAGAGGFGGGGVAQLQFKPYGTLVTSSNTITPRNPDLITTTASIPSTNIGSNQAMVLRSSSMSKGFSDLTNDPRMLLSSSQTTALTTTSTTGGPSNQLQTAPMSTTNINNGYTVRTISLNQSQQQQLHSQSNNRLDPKYFQSSSNTTTASSSSSHSPIESTQNPKTRMQQTNTTANTLSNSLDASKMASNLENVTTTGSNGIRINKQLVQAQQQQQQQQQANNVLQLRNPSLLNKQISGQTNNGALFNGQDQYQQSSLIPSKSTPSLASAYFPAN